MIYYGKILHDLLVDLSIAMMNLKPPVFKSVDKCCLLYVSSSVMISIIPQQGHVGLVGHDDIYEETRCELVALQPSYQL